MSIAGPGIMKEFGLSETQMGSVFSAFNFGYAIFMEKSNAPRPDESGTTPWRRLLTDRSLMLLTLGTSVWDILTMSFTTGLTITLA